MKIKATVTQRNRRIAEAVLGGALILVSAGCNCININVGSPSAPSHGGPGSFPPPPSGGNFVPFQSTITGSGTGSTLCGQQISSKHVNFYPPSQTPNPGENGFRGYLFNVATSRIISNDTYVLQWTVDMNNLGCASRVVTSTTDVSFPATAGLSYKLTAHFKPNKVPPNNPPITLYGAWITQ